MNIIDTWLEKRRNRSTYRELATLSDQMLGDIGITRYDLDKLRRGRPANDR